MLRFPRSLATFLLLSGLMASSAGCERKQVAGDGRAEAKRLFDSVCARCHGADGRGGVPAMEGQPAPSNFADAAFHVSRSDADLKKTIREGKGPMPPFAALFDDTQMTLLVAHVRSFEPKK